MGPTLLEVAVISFSMAHCIPALSLFRKISSISLASFSAYPLHSSPESTSAPHWSVVALCFYFPTKQLKNIWEAPRHFSALFYLCPSEARSQWYLAGTSWSSLLEPPIPAALCSASFECWVVGLSHQTLHVASSSSLCFCRVGASSQNSLLAVTAQAAWMADRMRLRSVPSLCRFDLPGESARSALHSPPLLFPAARYCRQISR